MGRDNLEGICIDGRTKLNRAVCGLVHVVQCRDQCLLL
jgi:hypothetical protein